MGLVELYISSFIAAKWHEPSRMEFDSDSSRYSDSEIGRDDDLSDDGDMSASSPSSRSPASSSSHPMDQASDSDGTLRGDGSAQADDFDPTLFMQEPLPYVAPTRPSSGGAAGAFVAEPIFSCAPPIRRAAASYNLECRRYDPAFMDAAMHGKFDDEIFIDYFMTDIDANLLRKVFACDVQLGACGRRTRRQKRQRRRHFRPRPCFRARVTQRTTAPATAPAPAPATLSASAASAATVSGPDGSLRPSGVGVCVCVRICVRTCVCNCARVFVCLCDYYKTSHAFTGYLGYPPYILGAALAAVRVLPPP
jgi:hypothetical protein